MNILVVAAHPDDEVLGCGGAIAKHIQQGDKVHILILAEGVTSRKSERNRDDFQAELSALEIVANKVSHLLGVSSLSMHDFPDNRMDSCELLDIVKFIEKSIEQYQPQIIYTHHSGDVNIDHRCIHQAVVTACRPIPNHPVHTLLFFEIPSSTEWQTPSSAVPFTPNWFVDISETLVLKLEALEAYESEMRSYPHPRSLEAVEYLARWRGATIGVKAAEAFMLGRHSIR
ncbi:MULTISPECIES: PIG-L deacetylase family protein [Pseudanabaena]|uniref:LmbE family protein n=2 Tax=Pseudanabaena TaxID=1152 RepID=L8N290_9CYAN|nr:MULTISPECIES: PIG-L deacetylase family protein [Pseudanabaena]ELS34322.1 LmbE family protein [Pseudanabaena biceps PCC 7429]MDG3493464.1 PIG-L family deacetylase [Pseudanabaena catenata USMAC16]